MKRVIHLILLARCGAAGSCAGAAPEVAIRLFHTDQIGGCTLADAEWVASNVLATAGVHVRWSNGPERTQPTAAETIDISFLDSMSARRNPAALAESFPFASGGMRVLVFFDRVSDFAGREPLLFPRALGYTLAHEIGHVLMGTDSHSLSGVMKAHWTDEDHYAIWSRGLSFTPEQAAMITSRLVRSRAKKSGSPV
jgi:hypothetical protein